MSTESIPSDYQQPVPEAGKPWVANMRRRLAIGAAALTLMTASAAVAYGGEGVFKEMGGVVTLEEAPSPHASTLKEVGEIVERPDVPEAQKIKDANQEVEFALKAAKEHDLHLVDYRPFEARLQQSTDLDSSEQVFKDFMKQYGFKADVFGPISTDWRNFPAHPLQKKPELKSELDGGIRSIMRSMFPVPVELAHATAVKEVTIQSYVGAVFGHFGRPGGGRWDTLHSRALLTLRDLDANGVNEYDPPVHEIIGHGMFKTFMGSYNDPKASQLLEDIKKTGVKEDLTSDIDEYGRTSKQELQAVTMERIMWGDLRDDRPAVQKMILLTLARVAEMTDLGGFPAYIREVSVLDQSS